MTPRTLQTAEDRREAVLVAAQHVVAHRGLHAPTTEIAKQAGISHAYLFRLFPTKAELAIALVERCNERILDTFAQAAAVAQAAGEDPIPAMGTTYFEMLADRELLMVQLHAHAACPDDPAIREAMRTGFARLVDLVLGLTGGDEEHTQAFFARGMLLNVLGALAATEVDAPWAHVLLGARSR